MKPSRRRKRKIKERRRKGKGGEKDLPLRSVSWSVYFKPYQTLTGKEKGGGGGGGGGGGWPAKG